MTGTIALIGAPTDIGAGARGASMGPEALRVAQLQAVLEAQGLQVIDRGNLNGPPNPWLPPEDGYRHLREVAAWNKLVHAAVLDELAAEQDGKAVVAKLNIDEAPELAARFGITSIPTLIVFKNGQPVKTLRGVQSKSVLTASLAAA